MQELSFGWQFEMFFMCCFKQMLSKSPSC